jgi:sulfide:quinone oxidoreductase
MNDDRQRENTMDDTQRLIDAAPLPDARELRRRRNLVIQFFHFVRLNLTMYRLARRHH